jgi:hypothetical protein
MKTSRIRKFVYGLCLPVVASGILAFAAENGKANKKDERKNTGVAPRRFDLKTIAALGQAIFEQDDYAARATDIILEKVGGPEKLVKEKIVGWIVVKRGKTVVVRFAKKDDANLRPAYDVTFDSRKKGTLKVAADKTYPENELVQFKARQLAIRNIPKLHSRSYNTVVLPDPAGRGFLVYVLAATDDANKIIVGGHYRFSISEKGDKILRTDPLFKSFLVIDKKELADKAAKEGTKALGYFVTNLVSELPLETHVFLSLTQKLPFVVTAPSGNIWMVDGSQIVKVDDDKEDEKRDDQKK